MKHAYCVIAHNEPYILSTLVSLLDDPRNDIYLMLDKKSNINESNLKVLYSNIYIIPRINIKWGDISQVKAELCLLKAVHNSSTVYSYIHLISGVDLPIKSQDYIHKFMKDNEGKEFVGIDNHYTAELIGRTRYYYPFIPNRGKKNTITGWALSKFIRIQDILRVKRKYDFEIKKGCNWVSITGRFCQYLLENEKLIIKNMKYLYCADELFIASLLWSSPFKNNIYNLNDEYKSCLRAIDWERGNPYTYTENDFEYLISHPIALFARKFSSKDLRIVDRIASCLKSETIGNGE